MESVTSDAHDWKRKLQERDNDYTELKKSANEAQAKYQQRISSLQFQLDSLNTAKDGVRNYSIFYYY
jgi:hypothetical protein